MAEVASFALAVLPLLVNRLDAYVQGIETIKSLRTRRYRRELKSWHTNLSSQRAIFENNFVILFSDVDELEDDVAEFLKRSKSQQQWTGTSLDKHLRTRLLDNYDVYMANMEELRDLLDQLCKKFGLSDKLVKKICWEDSSVFKREFEKLKDITLKSVYEKLLHKIKDVNSVLQTLTQQTLNLQKVNGRKETSQMRFSMYQRIRKHARSLHNAVISGQRWGCDGKHQHFVNLRLEPGSFGGENDDSANILRPRFRLVLFSSSTETSMGAPWRWQEVEIEPVEMAEKGSLHGKYNQQAKATSGPISASRKLRWADFELSEEKSDPVQTGQPILDICSALASCCMTYPEQKFIGFLLDQFDEQRQHRIYLIRTQVRELQTKSLEDILTSRTALTTPRAGVNLMLSPRKRLLIAATLASSVFQLHGNWLKAQWRTRDILFPEDVEDLKLLLDYPYVSWSVSGKNKQLENTPVSSRTDHPLIKGKIMLPLGLALVEISLGHRLADLRIPIDDHTDEAVANLTTATRLLDAGEVNDWSGTRYHEVVKTCLSWTSVEEGGLDDERTQRDVFESIVSPLLENLKDSEGRGQIQ